MSRICPLLVLLLHLGLSTSVAFAAPLEDAPTPSPEDAEFFESKVKPILLDECFQCHGAGRKIKGGLWIDTRERFLKGGDTGPGFVVGDPEASLTIRAVHYEDPDLEMPPWGKMEPEQIEVLEEWIRRGAPWSGGPLPKPDDGIPDEDEEEFAEEEEDKAEDAPRPASREEVRFFETRVLPVLRDNCFRCHGAGRRIKGDLRLTSLEHMKRGGYFGPAVVPGEPEESLLIESIRYTDLDFAMPPDGKLDDLEIADLYTWIKAGAVWPESVPALPEKKDDEEAPPKKDVKKKSGDDEAKEQKNEKRPESPEPPRQQQAAADASSEAENGALHWSFRPVEEPAVPDVEAEGWALSDLDRFVLAELEERGMAPVADADRHAWIRRVTFDLTGLPPAPEDVRRFIADDRPGAHERVVDRLLASKHYGERWGRHWLDVARYADTAGDSSDYPIPQAYLYRDWVIDAFNDDKPYDEFVREQIAGDILARETLAEGGSHDEYANRIVASGFLALSRRFGVGERAAPHLVIEDTLDTIGRSMLGLTLRCARCHDHKYDPIPMTDYYGLYGFFASTRYPFPGSENTRHPKDLVPLLPPDEAAPVLAEHRKILDAKNAALDSATKRVEKNRADVVRLQKRVDALAKAPLAVLPCMPLEAIEELAGAKKKDVAATKSKLAKARKARGGLDKAVKKAKRARDVQAKRLPPLDLAYAVVEGKPVDVKVHKGGNPRSKGPLAPRRFLTAIEGAQAPTIPQGASGRRELADWIIRADHPLTARVMANRVWYHHFGRGLVKTLDDFGVLGSKPSHPQLLDWLARRFVESGWSVKSLHREICLSRTYRLSSVADDALVERDPDNLWLARASSRRLDAESLRDGLLWIGGQLDLTPSGAHPFPPTEKWNWTQHNPFRSVFKSARRSVYLMTSRLRRHPYLGLFDGPDTNSCTACRPSSTVPGQALWFMNGELIHEAAAGLAKRLLEQTEGVDDRLREAYEIVLGGTPSAAETDRALAYIYRYAASPAQAERAAEQRELAAWESYARVLLASNEFLYLD